MIFHRWSQSSSITWVHHPLSDSSKSTFFFIKTLNISFIIRSISVFTLRSSETQTTRSSSSTHSFSHSQKNFKKQKKKNRGRRGLCSKKIEEIEPKSLLEAVATRLLRWGIFPMLSFLPFLHTRMWRLMRGIKAPWSWALIPQVNHLILWLVFKVLDDSTSVWAYDWDSWEITSIFEILMAWHFWWPF